MKKAKINQAFRLYRQYKTTTPQYRALATDLGYTSVGDLNSVFCARLNELEQRAARARFAARAT